MTTVHATLMDKEWILSNATSPNRPPDPPPLKARQLLSLLLEEGKGRLAARAELKLIFGAPMEVHHHTPPPEENADVGCVLLRKLPQAWTPINRIWAWRGEPAQKAKSSPTRSAGNPMAICSNLHFSLFVEEGKV
jgi:hypothetical protein